jgi:hypothetical protein
MNPLITPRGEPTSLAIFMDYVRDEGVYNMVTEFRAAVQYAQDLWESQTHTSAPFRADFTRARGALTLSDYMSVYTAHEDWTERCKTTRKTCGTLLNVIQRAPAPAW